MFNIDHVPEFNQTVEVRVPHGDGFETQSFKARFRVISDEDEETSMNWVEDAKNRLRARIVHVEDVVGGDGKPVEFSSGLLERMLGREDIRVALLSAYAKGMFEARAGN